MHLDVAELVPDVVKPFGRRQLTGPLEHALGHVDADDAARRRSARRRVRRGPRYPFPAALPFAQRPQEDYRQG